MNFIKKCLLITILIFTSKTITLDAIAVSKLDLPNKVVLITGASRGIGLATAKHLADKRFRVYGTLRDLKSLDTSKIKNVQFEQLDVTDPQSIKTTINKIIAKEGRIDVLINNAGYALGGALENLSMDDIKEQMDVNFFGAIRMCQEVLPQMRKQKSGHIVNISSEQGVYGLPYGSIYSASKAALEAMSEALSIELLPWNIDVSIIEPGAVATKFSLKMGTRSISNDPYKKICDYMAAAHKQKINQKELAPSEQKADEIAAFLCDVIDSSEPQLRYQTNKLSKEVVSMKLNDISGEDYLLKMKIMITDFQKRLIKN